MDGKVCSQQSSLCFPHPSSPAASPPPRNPALQRLSSPSPRQHSSQFTSPTYVLDPVYFLEDSVSGRTRGTAIPACPEPHSRGGCALGLLFSVNSVLLLRELCVKFFLPSKNKKRPDLSERFFNFYFIFSKSLQTFCIAGNSPLVFSSICSFRYTSELMSYVASSNPCPCVIASVGHASTQYPQKIHRE